MTLSDHQRAQELLAEFDTLEPTRQHIQELYDSANEGLGSYSEPDELSADVNESIRDIADEAMEILRRVTFK